MRSAGNAEQPLHFAGDETRDDDDAIGAVGVRADERGIVAANLRRRALRMRQEMQIVNGDDLRRRARRQQQRMR